MRIKKHKNRNHYLLTKSNVWIRNFTVPNVPYLDINKLNNDYELFIKNENKNFIQRIAQIDSEDIILDKIIIVSDGYNFIQDQQLLSNLDNNIAILATNGALAKWKLMGKVCPPELKKRIINYYIVNNPYQECMSFFPQKHSYFPNCIASTRTNNDFLSKYKGNKFLYSPVPNENYSYKSNYFNYMVDDYHNPICAAICLAYRFNVQKLLLYCCDTSFKENRAGSIKLENGLYSYGPQIMSQHIIDGMLYWLKQENVEVCDCSNGIKYEHCDYINKNDLINYFND